MLKIDCISQPCHLLEYYLRIPTMLSITHMGEGCDVLRPQATTLDAGLCQPDVV